MNRGERERSREVDWYEEVFQFREEWRKRAAQGKKFLRGEEVPFQQSRQSLSQWYLLPFKEDTAAQQWAVFTQEIKTKSGKHKHQGGVAIYILEGKGYSVVDGKRFDWEKGDMLLLPVQPGGCEHQHFNTDPEKPSKWLALRYMPTTDVLGNQHEQVENHPDFFKK